MPKTAIYLFRSIIDLFFIWSNLCPPYLHGPTRWHSDPPVGCYSEVEDVKFLTLDSITRDLCPFKAIFMLHIVISDSQSWSVCTLLTFHFSYRFLHILIRLALFLSVPCSRHQGMSPSETSSFFFLFVTHSDTWFRDSTTWCSGSWQLCIIHNYNVHRTNLPSFDVDVHVYTSFSLSTCLLSWVSD